jgi:Flp pilus assembly protein CpaB
MEPRRHLDAARRRILVHRRPLGASFAALAVWLVVQASGTPPPLTVPVWTAARDLPSGTVLTEDDLTETGFAPGSVPPAAARSPDALVGHTLATPLGRGEPVVTAHLVGRQALDGRPGRSAVAVRIPDGDVASLLTPGQRVALVASDPQGGRPSERLVEDAEVVALPQSSADGAPGALGGRLVVFAVPSTVADDVAAAAVSRYLAVVWTR